jgi:hypothetical protein
LAGFLPLRAEEAFDVEADAGFLAFDDVVLTAAEAVFAAAGGVCPSPMAAKTKQRMSRNSARQFAEKVDAPGPAPKGVADSAPLAAPLKRRPDTKPGFSANCGTRIEKLRNATYLLSY